MSLLLGDCRTLMPQHGPFDMILADPPYGDTSLRWDKRVDGWHEVARACLAPGGSMWVFGSLRYFMADAPRFAAAGWKVAQEIVWEKHNGSSFHADRFKRVHELAVQFYPAPQSWADTYNDPQKTNDATARTVRRKKRPPHTGSIKASGYISEDGGPRVMRSVIYMRSCHGMAIHETEKPVGLLAILIRTSCKPGGLVGDFFAGSGAGAEAAATCGRRYVGAEISPEYHTRATKRLTCNLFTGATV